MKGENEMAVKRLVLETKENVALPVGESIEITIKGYGPFICRVLNIISNIKYNTV